MLTDSQIADQIVNDISGYFAQYTVDQVTPYVTEARLSVSESFWCDKYDLASKYLAMHLIASLVKNGGASAAGPVASKSAGELSISYAVSTSRAYTSLYSTTTWGRRYSELLATMPTAMVV